MPLAFCALEPRFGDDEILIIMFVKFVLKFQISRFFCSRLKKLINEIPYVQIIRYYSRGVVSLPCKNRIK